MRQVSLATAEDALATVVGAALRGDEQIQMAIEALGPPVYLTNAYGIVTLYNKACINFAGRHPIPGRDRWCVTWRLYSTDGKHLPHAKCPMALAIMEKRPVRGLSAIAERPDGTRVVFTAFPTPLFRGGAIAGAVNMLIDITVVRQIEVLNDQAQRCRRLARAMGDEQTAANLKTMADEYEAKAREIEAARPQ